MGNIYVTKINMAVPETSGKRGGGTAIPKAFGIHGKALGSEDGILPVTSSCGTKIMSINLMLEHEGNPVVCRGPIIAGAVKQF